MKVEKQQFDGALKKLLGTPATPKKTIIPKKKATTTKTKIKLGKKRNLGNG